MMKNIIASSLLALSASATTYWNTKSWVLDIGTWSSIQTAYNVNLKYYTTYEAGEGPAGMFTWGIDNTQHYEAYGFTVDFRADLSFSFWFGADSTTETTNSNYIYVLTPTVDIFSITPYRQWVWWTKFVEVA